MRWTPGGRSPNLEDRRSGGGLGRGLGVGGTVVVLALSLLFGRNLFSDLGVQPGVGAAGAPMSAADSAAEEPEVQFVSFVLDDVQNTWSQYFPSTASSFTRRSWRCSETRPIRDADLHRSAMGPFYCPSRRARLSGSRLL